MAKFSRRAGTTGQSVNVLILNSTSTTGAGLAGLVFNSAGLKAYYSFTGANAGATAITLVTLAAVNSAYASGGFKELDATNMPGVYRLDIPNAALAAASGNVVTLMLSGATNMAPLPLEIELTGWDNQDAVAGGLSRIDAAVSSRMATFTLPANFSSFSLNASGFVTVVTNNDKTAYSLSQAFPTNFAAMAITAGGAVTAGTVSDKTGYSLTQAFPANFAATVITAGGIVSGNVTQWNGTAVATPATAGIPDVNTRNVNGVATAGIAQDAWNAVATSYNTALSMGNKLNSAASAGDPWTTALPGAYGAGTAGNILGNRLDVVVSGRMATFTLPTNFAALAITGGGAVTAADPWLTALPGTYGPGTAGKIVGTNLDTPVSTRQATMTLPPNFAALAITAGGAVTAGTVSDKAGYSLSASQSFNLLGNLTGNVTGSVGSVTGNVGGNVTGSVGSVTGLTVPANFATLAITAGGQVAIDGTSALTEAYPTLGGGLTLSNAMHTMVALWLNSSNAGTTVTLKKRDRTTTAKTATYDSATSPSSITEAT